MAKTDQKRQNLIKVEEGWPVIQEAVNKLIQIIEGDKTQSFTSEGYMQQKPYEVT
ncbi:hypothetical protein CCACVL1_28440 [Corchorus capsularis]|uniref:Uncharacterized protein n=1 Tax=Corchorus capsularis TaxID=210143 RepID=A0A1R3G6N1_COCAP|nr:hypothetical protein CCACVL1_28440 [Corchorus capsularis]